MKSLKVAGLIVAVLLIAGGYMYPKYALNSVGAVGDTQSTGKISQIVVNLSTTTYASLYNGDERDRIVDNIYYNFTGLGTMNGVNTLSLDAAWLHAGTSTNAVSISGNDLLFTTFATTSPDIYVATSSPGSTATLSTSWKRVWKAGTYLNFLSGTTTTAGYTGSATSSTATGIIGVVYRGL